MKLVKSYVVGLFILFISTAIVTACEAVTDNDTVKDDNNGAYGQILVNNGAYGNTDVGHWTSPTDIPGLKGDKGDKGDKGNTGATGPAGPQGLIGATGATGAQGSQGVQGEIGPQGDRGNDGTNGIDGVDGAAGLQGDPGVDGVNGVDGAKGDIGFTGDTGEKGDQGLQGIEGIKGDMGLTGVQGKDVDPVTVNKINNKLDNHEARLKGLEDAVHEQGETKVLIEGAVRLYDGKRVELQAFNSYDARHGHNFSAGIRLLFKVGSSYEERLMAKQQRDVEALAMYVSRLEEMMAVPAPAAIWFVSSNGEIQKALPKDPAYTKALLDARKK